MKKSIFKRVTSFVLASAVAASAMVSALAAGTSSITIYPGEHSKTGSSENERYVAYQLFTGTIYGTSADWPFDHEHIAEDDIFATSQILQELAEVVENVDDEASFKDAIDAAIQAQIAAEEGEEKETAKAVADYLKSFITGYDSYEAWLDDYNTEVPEPSDAPDNSDAVAAAQETRDAAVAALTAAYDAYKNDWENRHTMSNINWGSALGVPAEPTQQSDYDNVKTLLGTLAEDDNWSKFAPKFAQAFELIARDFDAAYDAAVGNDPDELAKLQKASQTAATRVAKLLGGMFLFNDFDDPGDGFAGETIDAGMINTEFLQKFAKVVYGDGSALTNGTTAEWDEALGAWVADVHNEGYYLVVDKKELDNVEGDSIAPYFLDVLKGQNINIYLKSDAPTLDKNIVATNEKPAADNDKISDDDKSAVVGIGDTVTYELTGTLPENFDEFNQAYYYRFADKLSAGLTYVGNMSITLTVGEDSYNFYNEDAVASDYADLTDLFSTYHSEYDATNGTDIYVTFVDLIAFFEALDGINNFDLDAITDWTTVSFTVRYDTVLNENAKIGEANENDAKLIYTNDPNSEYDPEDNEGDDEPGDPPPSGTSSTVKVNTEVYTFALELDKQNTREELLPGAGFTITDVEGKVAVFAEKADGEYIFVGWSEDTDLAAFKSSNLDTLEAILGEAYNSATLVTEVKVNTEGKLSIKGLDADIEYKFEETTVPENYSPVKHFSITLVAAYNNDITEVPTEETAVADTDGLTAADVAAIAVAFSLEDGDTWADVIEAEGTLTHEFEGIGLSVEDRTGAELFADIVDVLNSDERFSGKLDDIIVDGEKAADQVTAIINTPASGYAQLTVYDPDLTIGVPGTGGIGVYIYYIAGGALVLLAGAALFLTRKKSDKKA